MRFSNQLKWAWLAWMASCACAVAVFAEQPLLTGSSPRVLTSPSTFSSFVARVNREEYSGAAALASPLVPPGRGAEWITNEDCSCVSERFRKGTDFEGNCDLCPNHGLMAFVSYDSFKGRPDHGWQHNGIVSGGNFGTRLGAISDWTGIGMQIGGSAAAYDWSGTDYRLRNNDQAQPQGFITYGFYRKANENSNWSAAVVQDWMLNANFSVFAENPTISQWRGQVGYVLNPWNEIGFWGTWRGYTDSRFVNPFFGEVKYRAVSQASFFLHHKWGLGGADTSLWIGLPEHQRLGASGSLGDWLVGLSATVPLSDRIGLFAMVNYMHPSATAGPAGFDEEYWNFTIGLNYYFRQNARSNTVAGQCWMPMLPVANNGLFMADSSQSY